MRRGHEAAEDATAKKRWRRSVAEEREVAAAEWEEGSGAQVVDWRRRRKIMKRRERKSGRRDREKGGEEGGMEMGKRL